MTDITPSDALGPSHAVLPTEDRRSDTVWTETTSFADRIPKPIAILLLGVIILVVWHLAATVGVVSTIILPTPLQTANELVVVGTNLLTGGYMLGALWITFLEVLLGFLLATVIGVTLGVIVGETSFGERAVMPYLVALDTMPKIAFAPLFVAWLGFGIESKLALATFMATFPIIVGTAAGIMSAERNAVMLFRTMGATRWQALTMMKIPTGLPHIFTGLKIASLAVMAGAITAEFLGGGKGFGELIRVSTSQLDTARVFAFIIYLSLVGVLMYGTVRLGERRLVFWQSSKSRSTE